mgnify:FL=1
MRIIIELFLMFFKIGLFTFGGGYAMISIIENNCVEKKKWLMHEEMMDIAVIAESTPGPIAINCATFVGYKMAGILGAIVATLGVAIPSFIIIFAISTFLDVFLEIPVIANAFVGIKVGVGILIFNAGLNMLKKMSTKILSRMIMIGSFLGMFFVNMFSWKFSSISMMLVAAMISLFCFVIQEVKKEDEV